MRQFHKWSAALTQPLFVSHSQQNGGRRARWKLYILFKILVHVAIYTCGWRRNYNRVLNCVRVWKWWVRFVNLKILQNATEAVRVQASGGVIVSAKVVVANLAGAAGLLKSRVGPVNGAAWADKGAKRRRRPPHGPGATSTICPTRVQVTLTVRLHFLHFDEARVGLIIISTVIYTQIYLPAGHRSPIIVVYLSIFMVR